MLNNWKTNSNIRQNSSKKGYALSILLVALLVISIGISALVPMLSKKKDIFANTSTYVKECIVSQNAANLNTTACIGAINGLTKSFNKDYESVLYYLNNSTYTSTALKLVKASCDQGGSKACDIFINRCANDSTQCDIGGFTEDLNYYITMLSSDNSNPGKVYLSSRGADYYLQRMTNLNNAVKAVCNADMNTTACDIAAETKTRIYNFNPPQRSEFYESNSVTGTNFHDGIVDLKILTDPGAYPVYGWGVNNSNHQLGISTNVNNVFTPTAATTAVLFSDIVGNYAINCGIEAGTQKAYCWGSNGYGEAGINSTGVVAVPTAVKDPSGNYPGLSFSKLTSSRDYICGLDMAGKAYCWGRDQYDQLGNSSPTNTNRWLPTAVSDPAGGPVIYSDISAAYAHTCALEASTGKAYCWGNNLSGQLGDNTTTQRAFPVQVVGPSGTTADALSFSQIAVGDNVTCGLQSVTGKAYCWGSNGAGYVGDGTTTTPRKVPTAVVGPDGALASALAFTQISAYDGGCGIEAGTQLAYCWGSNWDGMLGVGDTTNRLFPTAVNGGRSYSQISRGGSTTCGLEAGTKKGYCWGDNSTYGAVGDGTNTDRYVPTAVSGGYVFAKLIAGNYNGFGLVTTPTINKAYITTTNNNQITNIIGGIKSFNMTYTQPVGTKVLGLVSFDGRANWKKWNGSAWVAATNNLSTYNFTTAGNANTPAELQTGLANLTTGGGTFDFAFYLETDSTGLITPSIDQVTVTYLKER